MHVCGAMFLWINHLSGMLHFHVYFSELDDNLKDQLQASHLSTVCPLFVSSSCMEVNDDSFTGDNQAKAKIQCIKTYVQLLLESLYLIIFVYQILLQMNTGIVQSVK